MAKNASPTATRAPQLDGRRLANDQVSLEIAPPAARLSLRATPRGATVFAKALGFTLPKKPKTSAGKGGTHALWLGPDEWLVIDTGNPDKALVPKLPNPNFSAVDVSHRNVAVLVSGPAAQAVLASGCPQDLRLSAFKVGACSRTVLGKAEVVIFRTDEDAFRVECWRSFAPYVWDFLADAARAPAL